MIEFEVHQVPVERIFGLRKRVLRPYLGEEVPYVLDDDHLPTTVAFAALAPDDRILGVARLTPEPPPFGTDRSGGWRLRAMATDPEARNLGVGATVLDAVIGYVANQGGGILWCNARLPARRLYERAGLRAWGEVWQEPEIGPHLVMWRDVAAHP